MRRLHLAAIVAALACPLGARADVEPLPARAVDLSGAHALALGDAFRANGSSNEAIWLNPASFAVAPRYGFGGYALHDFNPGADAYGISIADSSAGPVAAGVAANRLLLGTPDARYPVNLFHLALATQLSDNVFLGVTGKLIHTAGEGALHGRVTPDVGLVLRLEPILIGLVAYNLVDVHSAQLPRQYAAALAFSLPSSIHAEGDAVIDATTRDKTTVSLHAGLEYEVMALLSLRAGYVEDAIREQRAVTGGIGLLVPPGFGLDLGYRHELRGSTPARIFALGLNLAI